MRYRLQTVARYLFFRIIFLRSLKFFPKYYIVLSKSRRNIFFTVRTFFFGRVLYKCTPGMLGFKGSDRRSSFAIFETCLYFFDRYKEVCQENLLMKKLEYGSIMRIKRRRKQVERVTRKLLGLSKKKKTREEKEKEQKRKAFLKIQKFFLVNKGVAQFHVRLLLKALRRKRIANRLIGSLYYPLLPFSKCRIKKVRRI